MADGDERAPQPTLADGVDPVTGEPKRGWLGGYQRIEDGFGQGTVAAVVFLAAFFAWLLFADPI